MSTRRIFVCQECGRESPKWLGRCPGCGQWNSLVETLACSTPATAQGQAPVELALLSDEALPRLALPLPEFNRVLGGGLVPGSLVLIGGDPGIGKSTLLLQIASLAAQGGGRVLYVSGEESPEQVKLRAGRLGVEGKGLYLLSETDLGAILQRLDELAPSLVIVDSIQTMHLADSPGTPGSLQQVRECSLRLMGWAKRRATPVLMAGHVTKDGAIAGPMVLEHMVDVVLYMEGELYSSYRLLRGVKNRFGSTHEVGVFEMKGQGLVEVANPSQAFLSGHSPEAVGAVVIPVLEGTRPLLVELQALTSPTVFGLPRRTANGVDFNRLLLIAAVLGKRAGLALGQQDIMVNIAGGLRISEPAADLGMALAIASSFYDTPVQSGLAAVGEIGLSGELRAVPQIERRLAEAARLGFQRLLLPRASLGTFPPPQGIEPVPAANLREALRQGLRSYRGKAETAPAP